MLKKARIFLVAALVFVASITPAFANNLNADGALLAVSEDSPAQATISKILQLPIGTQTPQLSFHFQARKISVDERNTPADLDTMPALNGAALEVSFGPADVDTTSPAPSTLSIPKETGNLFSGVTFPHAGVYVYEISEIADTNTDIDTAGNTQLYYSQASYTLTAYVANHSNGGTYVYAVGVRIEENDLGQAADGKVDPTPGGDGEKYFYSQMIFTNAYVETNGPTDPEKPDPANESTLFVSKTVAGDFGDKTQYFNFSMDLSAPDLLRDVPAYYRAYVVENGAVVADLAGNAQAGLLGSDPGGAYIKISTSGETSFQLRHGQRLVFVDTPVGTSYNVNQAAATHYTPSFIITTNGVAGANTPGTMSNPLATGMQLVGTQDNSAAFTNTRDSVTPTGLNLNDVPFILMIALALGALVTIVVVKARKRSQESQ